MANAKSGCSSTWHLCAQSRPGRPVAMATLPSKIGAVSGCCATSATYFFQNGSLKSEIDSLFQVSRCSPRLRNFKHEGLTGSVQAANSLVKRLVVSLPALSVGAKLKE